MKYKNLLAILGALFGVVGSKEHFKVEEDI